MWIITLHKTADMTVVMNILNLKDSEHNEASWGFQASEELMLHVYHSSYRKQVVSVKGKRKNYCRLTIWGALTHNCCRRQGLFFHEHLKDNQ